MLAWGGADFVITHPKGYELGPQFTEFQGKKAKIEYSQSLALENVDFVYVKNWSATEPYGKVLGEYPEWMLTENHFKNAPEAKVMHCLPLRRNVELSDQVLDSPRSLLTEMAKNRTWSAQAVLAEILLGLDQKK
jgi:N-succinyl-L-ornithine transcarbamylase